MIKRKKYIDTKKMILSDNNKQIIKTGLLFLYTSTKVVLSTLLSIFVLDTCEMDINFLKDCSIYKNINSMTKFNTFVFSFNFFTLLVFVGFYFLEFYREIIFIKYLDIDDNLPNNNLKNELEEYIPIKEKLIKINDHYIKYSIVLVFTNIINFTLSISLLYMLNVTPRTFINIFSNIFLVTDKLYTSLSIARKSKSDFIPYSAFVEEFVIFNTIDANYKIISSPSFDLIIEKLEKPNTVKNMFRKFNLYNSRTTIYSELTNPSQPNSPINIRKESDTIEEKNHTRSNSSVNTSYIV